MQKSFKTAIGKAVEGNAWNKFTNPTSGRGQTAFPKAPAEQERLGVRWDYDGQVTKVDSATKAQAVYHKFQMQPNAGKIPSSVKAWRDGHGGTHAVMAIALVKKDGTKEDAEKSLTEAAASVQS